MPQRRRSARAGARRDARAIAAGDRRRADLRLDAVSGARAQRRRAPRRRRVHHRPEPARHRQRHDGRACAPGDARRSPIRSPAPSWNGWGATVQNTHFQPAAQAGLTADQVAATTSEMGVRFSRHDIRVGAADGCRRPAVRRRPERHGLFARRGDRLRRLDVHRAGRRARRDLDRPARPRRAADRPTPPTSRISRASSTRSTPRPARMLWTQQGRRPSARAPDRLTDAVRGAPLCPHVIVRRRRPASRLRLLHVPRQRRRARRRRPATSCGRPTRFPTEPRLLRAYADGTELRGPAGGAIWSAPTIDVEARRALRRRRQHLQRRGAADHRRDPGVRSRRPARCAGSQQMAPATPDVFGCTPGDVNCGERAGPDFDFGASPVLATLAGGRAADRRRAEVGRRLRARSRQEGRSWCGAIAPAAAADSAASSGASPRTPIASTCRWPRSTTPRRAACTRSTLATGERAWYAPPEPPACGKPSRACSGAQFSAVTAIPGVVFSPSNDGAVRAYATTGRRGRVARSTPIGDVPTVNGVRAHGRLDERPRAGRRGRDGLHRLGLRRVRPEAGQRAARLRRRLRRSYGALAIFLANRSWRNSDFLSSPAKAFRRRMAEKLRHFAASLCRFSPVRGVQNY